MKRNLAPFFLLFICPFTTCLGQTVQSFLKPIDSLASVKKGNFSSTEAGFKVDLPKATGGFDGRKGILYTWRLTEGYFYVGVEDRQNEIENNSTFNTETAKVIDGLFYDMTHDLFASKFEISSHEQREFDFKGHKTIEVKVILTDALALIRVFWVGNRAYKMAVLWTAAQKKYESPATAVFDTLTVVSKADTNDLIKQKVEASTPKPLPQTPRAEKLKTDTEDAGLKGKVKYVLTESQFVKGEKAGSPKQRNSEDSYAEGGDLLKSIIYDDTSGLPFEIIVYGYLGGSRVARTGSIEYGNELYTVAAPMRPSKPRDNRYDSKYDYKYDSEGRPSERKTYGNDGTLRNREVFKWNAREVERVLYDQDGKLNSRSLQTFDEKGNEIEVVDVNAPMSGWNEVFVSAYDKFDDHGNWTEKHETMSRTFQGRSKVEWVLVKFRTIYYF